MFSIFFFPWFCLLPTLIFCFGFSFDVSTTMIVQPGPLVDFLMANQGVKDPFSVDWNKVIIIIFYAVEFHWCFSMFDISFIIFSHQAKRTLKNLRVRVTTTNREYKISGLSENRCKDQMYVAVWYYFDHMFTLLWVHSMIPLCLI